MINLLLRKVYRVFGAFDQNSKIVPLNWESFDASKNATDQEYAQQVLRYDRPTGHPTNNGRTLGFKRKLYFLTFTNRAVQDVEEGQLRVFQKLDEPVTPAQRGLRSFLYGIDDDTFREHRIRFR